MQPEKSFVQRRQLRGNFLPAPGVIFARGGAAFRLPDRQIGAAEIGLERVANRLRRQAGGIGQRGGFAVGSHAAAPEVFSGGLRAAIAALVQFQLKGRAAVKGKVLQDALAEAVDGVNRGVVKIA